MKSRLILTVLLMLQCGSAMAQTYSLIPLGGPDAGAIREIQISWDGHMFVLSTPQNYFRHAAAQEFSKWIWSTSKFDFYTAIDSQSNASTTYDRGVYIGAADHNSMRIGAYFKNVMDRPADRPISARIDGELMMPQDNFIVFMTYLTGAHSFDTLPTKSYISRVESNADTIIALTSDSLYARTSTTPWKAIDSGITSPVTTLEFTPLGLIAGTESSGVYISSHMKSTWRSISSDLPDLHIHDVMFTDGYLFATTDSGVYSTTDEGATWVAGKGRISDLRVTAIAAHQGVLYAGTAGQGLFTSSIGKPWNANNVGIAESRVTAIQEHGGLIWCASLSNSVHTYEPVTKRWTNQPLGLRGDATIVKFISARDTLYALEASAGLHRWSDQSSSWIQIPLSAADSVQYSDMEFLDEHTAAIISDKLQILDLAAGESRWKSFGDIRFNDLEISNENIYLASDSGVFISTDRGQSWRHANVGKSTKVVSAGNALVVELESNELIRSTDNGVNWAALNDQLHNLQKVDEKLYCVGDGLYMSEDIGTTWVRILDTTFTNLRTMYRISKGNTLLGIDDQGMQELVAPAAVEKQSQSDHTTIAISPNPISSTASISIYSVDARDVDIDIFNELGQHMTTITSREHVLSGWRSFEWNASNLANGVYTLRLRIDGRDVTRQIVVSH